MPAKKIAIIGGASAYTPDIILGLIDHARDLAGSEIVLMDIDREHLDVIAALSRRLVEHAGADLRITHTTDRRQAVDQADFLLPQYRAGGLQGRYLDETIPLQYGVIGQETMGPGGLSFAMRAIPVALELAKDVQELAPKAWWLNYANPTSMVTQALTWTTDLKVIGLCDAPVGMVYEIARLLRFPLQNVTFDYAGINHAGWITAIYRDGKDLLPRFRSLTRWVPTRLIPDERVAHVLRLFQRYGLVPNYYLAYHYFRDEMVAHAQQDFKRGRARSQVIIGELPGLYEHYAAVAQQAEPKLTQHRGHASHADLAVEVIASMVTGRRSRFIVNVPGQGALADFAPDQVVEIPAWVDDKGYERVPMGRLPAFGAEVIRQVKHSEDLISRAAITGDLALAREAFAAHPLMPSRDVAEKILAEMLAAHRDYLPQFVQ
ncbi:MAG: family 4 glycosyl hydrolase [Symbiobacteriia bacterium]